MTTTTNPYKYRSRPKPIGCSSDLGRRDRPRPMMSSSSFPVSASECTDSASIDADPVSRNATNFVTAMPRLAPNAANTALMWRNVPYAGYPTPARGGNEGLLDPGLEILDRGGLAWVNARRDGQVHAGVVGELDDARQT